MELPYGYLITLGLIAICTLSALVAPRRPRPLGMLSFRLGVVIKELPFVALAWLLASAALAIVQGDLNSPVIAVVTAAGLGVVAWRGSRALPVVERALGAAPVSRRLPYGRILFRPFFRRRRDVERIGNLRYGEAAGPTCWISTGIDPESFGHQRANRLEDRRP